MPSGQQPRRERRSNDIVAVASVHAAPPNGPLSGVRILLVDDNVGTSTLLAGSLHDAGGMVDVVRTAESCISLALRHMPNVIVVHLPAPLDAAAVLTLRLHSHNQLADVPVLALSGRDRVDEETAAIVSEVHPRPFSAEQVVESVGKLSQAAERKRSLGAPEPDQVDETVGTPPAAH